MKLWVTAIPHVGPTPVTLCLACFGTCKCGRLFCKPGTNPFICCCCLAVREVVHMYRPSAYYKRHFQPHTFVLAAVPAALPSTTLKLFLPHPSLSLNQLTVWATRPWQLPPLWCDVVRVTDLTGGFVYMGGKSHNTTSPRLLILVYVEVTCVHCVWTSCQHKRHSLSTLRVFLHVEHEWCVCVRVLVFSCLHGRNGRRRGKKIV